MSTQESSHKLAETLAGYLATKTVLIADETSSSRTGIAFALSKMGASSKNIRLSDSFAHAQEEIAKAPPDIIITDYEFGKGRGLELLRMQRERRPETRDCLFILVTRTATQSAVARAAEEDVDTYLLKPYTIDIFRKTLFRLAAAKIRPTPFHLALEEGKHCLQKGELEQALAAFEKARELDPRQPLPYAYRGQALLALNRLDEAEESYRAGLGHNPIHYRCLTKLYELLMLRKKLREAYDVMTLISSHYPISPQLLTSALKLAIVCNSYDDIERYYEIFKEVDYRDENLVRHVCAALVVSGKHHLIKRAPSRALEFLEAAAVSAGSRTSVLKEIILTLCKSEFFAQADPFLKRYPAARRGEPEYLALEYVILDRNQVSAEGFGKVIAAGRKLIKDGVHHPLIYDILIRRSAQAGYQDTAEALVQDAVKRWPDRKSDFLEIMAVIPSMQQAA